MIRDQLIAYVGADLCVCPLMKGVNYGRNIFIQRKSGRNQTDDL